MIDKAKSVESQRRKAMGPRFLRGTAHDATKNPKTGRLPAVLTLHKKVTQLLVWPFRVCKSMLMMRRLHGKPLSKAYMCRNIHSGSNKMKITWKLLLTISLALFLSNGVFAKDQGAGKRYVFNVIGAAPAVAREVPDPDGEPGELMPADCFDVDLIDMKNKRLIGTATDCLSRLEVVTGDFEHIRLIGTTTFNLPQGSLTTQGLTTVAIVKQPTHTPPTPSTPNGVSVTHITGAAGIGNAIIGGTGRFRNASGTARLSGMVDLSEPGEITFDCIFVIDLE
jgi:hypothetical protein